MDTEPRTHMIHGPGHLGSWGMLRKDRDEHSILETTPADNTLIKPLSGYKCTR